jgi:hypothetical protein
LLFWAYTYKSSTRIGYYNIQKKNPAVVTWKLSCANRHCPDYIRSNCWQVFFRCQRSIRNHCFYYRFLAAHCAHRTLTHHKLISKMNSDHLSCHPPMEKSSIGF